MSDSGNKSSPNGRVAALERLSMLQKLRDQAQANKRQAMLATLEKMIQAEGRAIWGRKVSQGKDANDPHP